MEGSRQERGPRVRVSCNRVGEGSTRFEGRDSRVSVGGSRGSAPATAASGTEDAAKEPEEEYVEVTVEAEPTPPKVAPGIDHQMFHHLRLMPCTEVPSMQNKRV